MLTSVCLVACSSTSDGPLEPSGGTAMATGGTGGASLTGGTSTGGVSSGGAPTGGVITGGAATGGVITGGAATGGLSSGGSGGIGTGGTPSGGTETGSTDTGGTATGGTITGGAGGTYPAMPLTIWLAGDSTVANGSTPCPRGWGRHFDAEFDDRVTTVNSAAGGRSVRTWLYSVTSAMGGDGECVINTDANGARVLQTRWSEMLAGMKAGDYLFIQFGINDGSSSCDRHVGLEAFKDEYGMMAQAARDRGAIPVFVTPVSAIGCSGSTAVGTRGAFVTATLQAGTEFGVPVIDLHQLSVDLYNQLAFCPVPGGDVSASTTGAVGDFFCDDHTHFSESGAASIALLVAQAVRDLELPLATYLK